MYEGLFRVIRSIGRGRWELGLSGYLFLFRLYLKYEVVVCLVRFGFECFLGFVVVLVFLDLWGFLFFYVVFFLFMGFFAGFRGGFRFVFYVYIILWER